MYPNKGIRFHDGEGQGGKNDREVDRRVNKGLVDALGNNVAAQARGTVAFTLVGGALGRLTNAIRDLDRMQQTALGIGTTANQGRMRLEQTVGRLPGGMQLGMENAFQFVEGGMKEVNKGMLTVAAQAKLTGKDSSRMIQGLLKLDGALTMSSDEVGALGLNLIERSKEHGITTTALVGALEANIETLRRLEGISPEIADRMQESILGVTQELGANQTENVTALTKMISLQGGLSDLPSLFVQFGGQQLEEMRKGNFSAEMIKKLAEAGHKKREELFEMAGRDAAAMETLTKGIGVDTKMLGIMESIYNASQEAANEEKLFTQKMGAEFTHSLGNFITEFLTPLRMLFVPWMNLLIGIGVGIRALFMWSDKVLPIMRTMAAGALSFYIFMRMHAAAQKIHMAWQKIAEGKNLMATIAAGGPIHLLGAIFAVGAAVTAAGALGAELVAEKIEKTDDKAAKRAARAKGTMTGATTMSQIEHAKAFADANEFLKRTTIGGTPIGGGAAGYTVAGDKMDTSDLLEQLKKIAGNTGVGSSKNPGSRAGSD